MEEPRRARRPRVAVINQGGKSKPQGATHESEHPGISLTVVLRASKSGTDRNKGQENYSMNTPSNEVKAGGMMSIAPTPEFTEAFEQVTGLECTPANVIGCIRNAHGEFQRVRERHAAIVERKI